MSRGIADVSQYVLDDTVIGDAPVFKLSAWPDGPTFVTDAFVEAASVAGLRGVAYYAVWPRGGATQGDLGVWAQVAARLPALDGPAIAQLPLDVRAYVVTRIFEWQVDADGLDSFFVDIAELVPFVGPGYRRLGLTAAAEAFEALIMLPAIQALLADPNARIADIDWEVAEGQASTVGRWEAERLAFVAAHPASFTPFLDS